MNIRDHIIAGHYSVDVHGRALVPVASVIRGDGYAAWVATICATDACDGTRLVGFGRSSTREWTADGEPIFHDEGRLMPPREQPPGVTFRRWAVYRQTAERGKFTFVETSQLRPLIARGQGLIAVELVGEYDGPWS